MNSPRGDAAFLRIEAVTKSFGDVRAVDGINLDVARGEIFALLGPSGCGKSTLLRVLAGFESPTNGRVVLDGVDITGSPPYERPVNMMFQSYALFPHLSVWDNIAFGLRRDRLPKDQVAARVEEMLRLTRLAPLAARKPHQLSGGQQQCVALARSLAKRPRLLLLDEPLGALDKKLREATQIELVTIVQQIGVTCVLVTHDQEEAMTMASRIAIMNEGRFEQIGVPDRIYEHPETRFVADFIGDVNLIDGAVQAVDGHNVRVLGADGMLHVADVAEAVSVGQSVTVALRPEKIHLAAELQQRQPAVFNQVTGVVKALVYFGDYSMYHLELPSGAQIKVSIENETRHRQGNPKQGETVMVWWLPDAAVLLTR